MRIFVLLLAAAISDANAQTAQDVWGRLLRATDYAAAVKAGIGSVCRESGQRRRMSDDAAACSKIMAVPNQVIENAAVPGLKKYLGEEMAKQAMVAWSSARGRALAKKIVSNAEPGALNRLTPSDVKILSASGQSDYGRAFREFATDSTVAVAVAKAMLTYAWNASAAEADLSGFVAAIWSSTARAVLCQTSRPVIPSPNRDFKFQVSIETADGRRIEQAGELSCRYTGQMCSDEWQPLWQTSRAGAVMQFSMGDAGTLTVGYPSCGRAAAVVGSSSPEGWQCAESNCRYDRGRGKDEFGLWDIFTRPESMKDHGFRVIDSSIRAIDR